ncbi:MAG: hypothetical protein KGS44_13555 [Alphaproteobacteria bacterium]|jgi:predicted  nucleic acid-binding Zn-ribbon protein|nr:hypothetical protein [Alphaproteobacteria bacterium]
MASRSEASAVGAWWNAVKRFAEQFNLSIPSGRSPRNVFNTLAKEVSEDMERLRDEVQRMKPIVDRYEKGTLLAELRQAKARALVLKHEVKCLSEGHSTLVAEIDRLKSEIRRQQLPSRGR